MFRYSLVPILVFTLIAALAFSVPVSASEEGTPPDAVEDVEPCCQSFPAGTNAKRGGVMIRGELPDHQLFPPETLAAMKEEARTTETFGPALKLAEGPSDLVLDALPKPDTAPTLGPKRPRLQTRFDGLDIIDSSHQGFIFIPPDTQIAASETKVIQATNTGLRLTNRSGGDQMLSSLNDFFGELYPPVLFDPRIHYDNESGRFFLIAVSFTQSPRRSFIFLSVSRTNDPGSLSAPEEWCNYRINAKRAGAWADYPTMGMNERWFVVSTNHFKFSGGFSRVNLFVLDKEKIADNADGCPGAKTFKYAVRNDLDGFPAFTVNPAQHYSSTDLPGTPLFLVSSQPLTFSDTYNLWRLEGNGRRPKLKRDQVQSEQIYSVPPEAPHPQGLNMDTGDFRIMQVAFRDGKIWAVHASGCDFGGAPNESCVRAVEITPTEKGGEVTFESTYGGGNGWYYWMPGVAINARGDVVVPFQRSRNGSPLEAAVNGKQASRNKFDNVRRLRKGTCDIDNVDSSDRNRIGDYVGAQADPADERSFWVAAEFSDNMPLAGGCSWNTRAARVFYK